MRVFDRFWNEFLTAHDRLPVWVPGSAIEVGDVGVLGRRGWLRLTGLTALGIPFSTRQVASNPSLSYASSGAVDFSVAASAQAGGAVAALPEARAGTNVSFSRGGAFVIRAENAQYHEIKNRLEVEDAIQAKTASGEWRRRPWILVTEVVTAAPVIVLIADSAGAKVVIEVTAAAGQPELALVADGKGKVELSGESALATSFVNVQRTPLMWRGRRQRGWPWKGSKDLGGPDDSTARRPDAAAGMVDCVPSAGQVPEDPQDLPDE